MVGMKRPCPFSVENAPGPSFHCKFRPTYVSPMSRSDESASCSYGIAVNIEPPNPVFRLISLSLIYLYINPKIKKKTGKFVYADIVFDVHFLQGKTFKLWWHL